MASPAEVSATASERTRARSGRGGVARTLARDPALWAWAVVALLALMPMRAALTAWSAPTPGALPQAEAPAPAPVAERLPTPSRG